MSKYLPFASIIVPVYNAEKTIASCLSAILTQDYSRIADVIVVDDGSTDKTAEITQTFSQVKIVSQKNAGPAAARNRGAKEASGEILFFTDSDCVPQQDWVSKMVPHFIRDKNGVVAGSYGITNSDEILARCIHQEILFRHQKLMPDEPRVFGSYNFAIRKILFEKVAGFDEKYRYPSGEDNDLSYKVIASGYKIYFERSALVNHVHPSRLGRYLFEQYRHGFWRVKMYKNHPAMSRGDDYTFWKDMVEVPLAVASIFLGLAGVLLPKLLIFFITLISVLYLIEIFFACLMVRALPEKMYFSLVMFLRAFWRTAGFVHGGIASFFSPGSSCPRPSQCRQLIV